MSGSEKMKKDNIENCIIKLAQYSKQTNTGELINDEILTEFRGRGVSDWFMRKIDDITKPLQLAVISNKRSLNILTIKNIFEKHCKIQDCECEKSIFKMPTFFSSNYDIEVNSLKSNIESIRSIINKHYYNINFEDAPEELPFPA